VDKALRQRPSETEQKVLLNVLGDKPQIEGVQDIFWSTLISPEFQFID
jgi:hypothetical protein